MKSIEETLSQDALLGEAADEFTQRLHAGQRPDIEEYARRYPQIAAEIRQVFPALQLIQTSTAGSAGAGERRRGEAGAGSMPDREDAGAESAGQLGDYRIVREIGRGGMGVVYEAEQLSLRRRVALKVLPFAAVLDRKQLQRFRNEAQAAAHLHHTHIVPVFAVGCERGVHYYAMQYIEGHPLSAVIEELKRLCGLGGAADDVSLGATAVSQALISGREGDGAAFPTPADTRADPAFSSPASPTGATGSSTSDFALSGGTSAAHLGLSAQSSHRGRSFFRSVAQIAIQAAEALHHAHDQGIIHRDVKPSNLLLDVNGSLWITDFGLALVQTDSNLTMPGDLVGTIRYMSPEQALAKRIPIDHRTDIYSLGVTLYELLTLQPVFGGRGRGELLRQIAFEDPISPRKLCPSLPRELETILGKAMAKRPDERYGSAQEMADDLKRFLQDKPILAKPPTVLDRVAKWARRHRPVVAAAALLLVLAVVGLSVSNILIARERDRTQSALTGEQRALAAARENSRLASQHLLDAQLSEQKAREALYAARINLAQQAVEGSDIVRALELLNSLRPEPDEEDLRGFEWYHLWRLCHDERLTLYSFSEEVRQAVYSPDGNILATPHGTEVKLWDPQSGELLSTLQAARTPIRALAFSPDSRLLAVAGGNRAGKPGVRGEVQVWALATGQNRLIHSDFSEPASAAAFTPDGRRLAVGTAAFTLGINSPFDRDLAIDYGMESSRIRLYDVGSGEEVGRWEEETESILSLALSPDGAFLAAGTADSRVIVWQMVSRTKKAEHKVGGYVSSVSFSPGGSVLAAAWGNWRQRGEVALWKFPSMEAMPALRGHQAGVTSVTFAPSERQVATASFDRTIRLWSFPRGQMQRALRGHRHFVSSVAFSPDGQTLATSSYDNTVKTWDVSNPFAGTRILEPPVNGLALLPDGITVTSGQSISLIDRARGEIKVIQRGRRAHATASPDGRWIAAIAGMRNVEVWDTATGTRALQFDMGQDPRHMAFSPDGRTLACGGDGDTVSFHDLQTGRVTREFRPEGRRVRHFAFSPDGSQMATATWDGAASVQIWNLSTGEARRLSGRGACTLAYSPDGRLLAIGRGSYLALSDVATGQQRFSVAVGPEEVWNIAFSPDGRTVATQSWDGAVRLWMARTGHLLWQSSEGGAVWDVEGLAFSRDGLTLAAGNSRGSQFWDAAGAAEAEDDIDGITHRIGSLMRLDRLGDAEAFARGALSRCWQRLGNEHVYTARVMTELASLLIRRRDDAAYAEAESLIVRARSILGKRLAPGHPWRWRALYAARDLYAPEAMNDAVRLAQIDSAIGYQADRPARDPVTLPPGVVGRVGGKPFELVAPAGGLMVGLNIATCALSSGPRVVCMLQPLYRSQGSGSVTAGPTAGRVWYTPPQQILAREGYAVGGIQVRLDGDELCALRLTFMRLKDSQCDPDDVYQSEWVGGPDGEEQDLGPGGKPLVGLRGRCGNWINALGPIRLSEELRAPPEIALLPTASGPVSAERKEGALQPLATPAAAAPPASQPALPEILAWSKESPEGVSRAVQAALAGGWENESVGTLARLIYADHLLLGGEFKRAERLISGAINEEKRLNGRMPVFCCKSLGLCLLALGQKDAAKAAFSEVIADLGGWPTQPPPQADPDHWTAAYFLDLVTREEYTSRWLHDGKHHARFAPFAWFYVGQRAEMEGRIEEAILAYERSGELGRLPNAHHSAHFAAYRLEILRPHSEQPHEAQEADAPATRTAGG